MHVLLLPFQDVPTAVALGTETETRTETGNETAIGTGIVTEIAEEIETETEAGIGIGIEIEETGTETGTELALHPLHLQEASTTETWLLQCTAAVSMAGETVAVGQMAEAVAEGETEKGPALGNGAEYTRFRSSCAICHILLVQVQHGFSCGSVGRDSSYEKNM